MMTFVERTSPLKASSKNARTKLLLFFAPEKYIYSKLISLLLIGIGFGLQDNGGLLQTSVLSFALLLSAEFLQGHIRTALFSKASVLVNLVP